MSSSTSTSLRCARTTAATVEAGSVGRPPPSRACTSGGAPHLVDPAVRIDLVAFFHGLAPVRVLGSTPQARAHVSCADGEPPAPHRDVQTYERMNERWTAASSRSMSSPSVGLTGRLTAAGAADLRRFHSACCDARAVQWGAFPTGSQRLGKGKRARDVARGPQPFGRRRAWRPRGRSCWS